MPARAIFVDTNVILRHLLNDVPEQSSAARRLFTGIEEGSLEAWTSPLVVAELVFVLGNPRTYAVPPPVLRDILVPLLQLPGLRSEHKRLFPRMFELYARLSIDFVDAYHAVLIEAAGQHSLYSFDTHFDRVPGLTRLHL